MPELSIRMKNRVGVGARTRVVRAVGYTSYAGIEQRQHRQQISDIHVVRTIVECKISVQRLDVLREIRIRDNPSELILPAMAMAIDDAGEYDHSTDVNHNRLFVFSLSKEVGANRRDPSAFDENVTRVEIADFRVEADDGGASQKDPRFVAGCVDTLADPRPITFALLVIGLGRCARTALHQLPPFSS